MVADFEGVEYQLELANATPVLAGSIPDATAGAVRMSGGLLADTAYRARARITGARGAVWSDWVTATTHDLRYDVSDLGDDLRASLQEADRVVADFTALVGDFTGTLPALEGELVLREVGQVNLEQSLADAHQDILYTLGKFSETQSTLTGAGIYTDPATGEVRINAVDVAENRISETEIRLEAAEANINLRATQAYVQNEISRAVIDASQVPVFDDIQARLSAVEVDLDAAESTLTQTASLTELNGLDLRVSDAELEINALEGQIALKLDTADFTPFDTRLTNAEVAIENLDGPRITQAVAEVRELGEAAALADVASLADLLRAYEGREAVRRDIAYATQDLRARVDEDRAAVAEQTLALGVAVDQNQALIEAETRVRANENSALAEDITRLDARLGSAENDLSAQATAAADLSAEVSDIDGRLTSTAEDITSLSATLSNANSAITGNANAISGLTARVTDAEGEISSQASAISNLTAALSSAQGDISGNANALSGLSARVTDAEGEISSQASAITSLQSTVGDHSTSIAETTQTVDGVMAERALRIDNNGVISGYVIRSELDDNNRPATKVGFVADQFAITAPGGGTDATPFVVHTTTQVIDGVSVPPGVYLKDAQIRRAAIGRAQVADVIESDNYQESGGVPTNGLHLNFKTGEVKSANLVLSRQLVLAEGAFSPGGTAGDGSEYLFINTGIVIGGDDVWNASNVALVATAALTSTGTADGGISGYDEFWSCEATIMQGARWRSGGAGASVSYRNDPPQLVYPHWRTGGGQRVRLRIKVRTAGVWFNNPKISWKVFQVT